MDFPAALGANATKDEITIRTVEVQGVGELRAKLRGARNLALSIVYDQFSQEVKDKLQSEQGWDVVDRDQSIHDFITRIRGITTVFEEHK